MIISFGCCSFFIFIGILLNGSTCVICQEIPKLKVDYDIGQGSNLVDFYCSNCLEKHLAMMTEKIDVVSVVTNGVLGFW